MFCPNCGKEVGNSKFCNECGTKIYENDFTETLEIEKTSFSDEDIISNSDIEESEESKESGVLEEESKEEYSSRITDNPNPVNKQSKRKGMLIYVAIGIVLLAALAIALVIKPKYVTGKAIKVSEGQNQVLSGLYTGYYRINRPDGTGKFSAETSNGTYIYDGEWEKGIPVGIFTVEDYKMGVEYEEEKLEGIYSGEVKNLIPNGKGKFDFSEDDRFFKYDGDWKNGIPSGNGKLKCSFYVVHFEEFDRTGEFDGDVINLMAEGEGEFSFKNSENIDYFYEGEWKESLFNGQGTLKWNTQIGENHYTGRFIEGNIKPTVYEYYKTWGEWFGLTNPAYSYKISSKAKSFLDNNESLFKNNSTKEYTGDFEELFSYDACAKNSSNYGDKLVRINLKIIQIVEGENFGGKETFIVAQDKNGNAFIGLKLNHTKGIKVNDSVTAVLLPLAHTYYQTLAGDTRGAVASAFVTLN